MPAAKEEVLSLKPWIKSFWLSEGCFGEGCLILLTSLLYTVKGLSLHTVCKVVDSVVGSKSVLCSAIKLRLF